jgi:hypothetical protein
VGVVVVGVLMWITDLFYNTFNAWLDSAGFQRIDYDALGVWCGLTFVVAMVIGIIIAAIEWLQKAWRNSKADCGEGTY